MNTESLIPFALIITPFFLAFFIEGIVLYFFKIKAFWSSIGIAVAVNLLSLVVIFYAIMPLLGKLGYQFNGLELPVPVVLFLWWFSSIADGLLVLLFFKHVEKKRIFSASIIMNALSYLFLYIFIVNSHS